MIVQGTSIMGNFNCDSISYGIISYCFDLFILFCFCFGFLFAMRYFPNAAVEL